MTSSSIILHQTDDLFGHPRGLTVLFLTGMWEVFALVGMRAVLIYYLVKQLYFADDHAVEVYSLAAASCILMGVAGAFVADRYLGIVRAVIIGAALMGVGSFLMVMEQFLYPGLALIAIGNGLFRPTLAAQVGLLYAPGDPRRDRAYIIYKVGCNIGAMLAPLVCGAIGEFYGWSWAFFASGVGMIISIGTFVSGLRHLPKKATVQDQIEPIGGAEGDVRKTLILLSLVWIGSVLFWVAYRQSESSLVLWVDQDLDRTLTIGASIFVIPAAWFQAINPFLIFAFAPIMSWMWARYGKHVSSSQDIRRIIAGCLFLAASFSVLAIGAWTSQSGAGISPTWFIMAIALLTVAELYVDPVGQSLFTRLAIKGLVSLFMSLWIVGSLAAYVVTAWLGSVWVNMDPAPFFTIISVLCVSASVVVFFAGKYAGKRV